MDEAAAYFKRPFALLFALDIGFGACRRADSYPSASVWATSPERIGV